MTVYQHKYHKKPGADYDDVDIPELEVDPEEDTLANYRYPNGDLIDIHETPPSQYSQSL